jgi:hypothetical protein
VSRSPDGKLDMGLLEVLAFWFRHDTDDNGVVNQQAISCVIERQLTAIWKVSNRT